MGLIQVVPVFTHFTAGQGYVSGEAPGLLTVNGSPAARRLDVRNARTRSVVATTFSGSNGAYRFDGLDPDEEFEVIGRDFAGTYNDAIVARVRPEPYDVRSASGTFTVNDAAKTLVGAIDIFGGAAGHTVEVTAGAAPADITFAVVTAGTPTYAHVARWLIASGTAAAGAYTWTLTVTAPNGSPIDIACSATVT